MLMTARCKRNAEMMDGENRHNLTDVTRDMVKNSTDDVKTLAAFPAGGPHVSDLAG